MPLLTAQTFEDQELALAALESYKTAFPRELLARMRAKLGLADEHEGDMALVETVLKLLAADRVEYRVYRRDRLRAGDRLDGPAVIEETGTTTVMEPGDTLTVEPHGCLVIAVGKSG